jgi:hypothetical protein
VSYLVNITYHWITVESRKTDAGEFMMNGRNRPKKDPQPSFKINTLPFSPGVIIPVSTVAVNP